MNKSNYNKYPVFVNIPVFLLSELNEIFDFLLKDMCMASVQSSVAESYQLLPKESLPVLTETRDTACVRNLPSFPLEEGQFGRQALFQAENGISIPSLHRRYAGFVGHLRVFAQQVRL